MMLNLPELFFPTLLTAATLLSLLLLTSKNRRPPNPAVLRGYPIVGNAPRFIHNRNRILNWLTELVLRTPTATVTIAPIIFTANPANVEHISRTNFSNYLKGDDFTAPLHDFLGRGILNSEADEDWKLQRKIASVEFNTRTLRLLLLKNVQFSIDRHLFPLLSSAALSGRTVNLEDNLQRLAFDSICSLTLGVNTDCLGEERNGEAEIFYRAFGVALQLSVDRAKFPLSKIWKLRRWMGVGSERKLKESIAIVRGFIDRVIRSHRETPGSENGDDLLSRFASKGRWSDEYIRNSLINFVVAGRETTPSALTWLFWILSLRADVTGKIRKEILAVRARRGDEAEAICSSFSPEELKAMDYLQAAITEVLRLYPPAPFLLKVSAEDDVMPDGTEVKKGWSVIHSAYAMARAEALWGEDCREYRPERWMDAAGKFRARGQFEYPVFNAGPRVCLGKEMSYLQMRAVAVAVIERFDFEVVGERGVPELSLALRMKGGLPVKVRERSNCEGRN